MSGNASCCSADGDKITRDLYALAETEGLPAEAVLEKELKGMQDRVRQNNAKNKKDEPVPTMEQLKGEYGASYRNMLAEVKETLGGLGSLFPALKGRTTELAGLVWFQGWNDQYGGQDEYASNLKHFIHDVRKDFARPGLPVVIVAMGQNGSKPAKGAMLTIREAQLSMNEVPEFAGNVRAFRSDLLVDKAAEELYPTWRQNVD